MSDGPAAADHLSLDALAELDEGIAGDADALRRHLDGCAECRERAGQLRATRALLSALPPAQMPADVAARVDAALAAEPAPSAAPGFGGGGTIVPMNARRPWWRSPNFAAAAASVAVLALAAALLVGHFDSAKTSTGSKAATTDGAAAGPNASSVVPVVKQWASGANYTPANRIALATRDVLLPPQGFTPSSPVPAPTVSTAAPTRPSGLAASTKPSYTLAELRNPATVVLCASLLVGHPVLPLAIDYAYYNGTPAAILVVPGISDPARYWTGYVIPTACSDNVADIAYFQIPRPTH